MTRRALAAAFASALVSVLGLSAAPPPAPAAGPSWTAVDAALGAAGKDLPGGVHRFGWPRRDLAVRVGEVPVAPALALGSWAAFRRMGSGGQAMAMGDLALLEPELPPVLAALAAGGIEVAAIHNHLAGEAPRVVYVHFAGRGDAAALAASLRRALAATATPVAPAAPAATAPADEEAFARLERALGRKGTRAGAVLQVSVPRAEAIAMDGMEIPPAMGVATAINVERAGGDRVAATGDFVLLAAEVNPVVRELRAHGIEPSALHSHMLDETPRLFFLHFWGVGAPEAIGAGLQAALAHVHSKP